MQPDCTKTPNTLDRSLSTRPSHRNAHVALAHLPVSSLVSQDQQRMTHHRRHLLALDQRRMARNRCSMSIIRVHPTQTLPRARSRLLVSRKPLTWRAKRRVALATSRRKPQRHFGPRKTANRLAQTPLLLQVRIQTERTKGTVRKCTTNSLLMLQTFSHRTLRTRMQSCVLHPTFQWVPKMDLQWDLIPLEVKATSRFNHNSSLAIGIPGFKLIQTKRLP